MRKHVFPVCKPSFNVLDFDTIDETQSYTMYGTTEAYAGVSSTGVKWTNSVKASLVETSNFFIEDVGEYLVNDDISAPSETTLDWTGDANRIQINAYSFDTLKNSINTGFVAMIDATKPLVGLPAGAVICIGSKPPSDSAFRRNVLPGVFSYKSGGLVALFPLSDSGFSFTLNQDNPYDSTGIAWVTLMWSGTRWVYLGSSTWL